MMTTRRRTSPAIILLLALNVPPGSGLNGIWSYFENLVQQGQSRRLAEKERQAAVEERRRFLAELASAHRDQEEVRERVQLIRSLAQRIESGRHTLARLEGRSRRIRRLRTALQAQIRGAGKVGLDTPVTEIRDAASHLDVELRRASRVVDTARGSGRPAAWLFDAVGAYFAGDYELADNLLANANFTDPALKVQGHLFRAAANYARYVRGGEKDRQLMETAIADIRECRRLNSSVRLSRSIFSPRFIAFFEQHV